MPTAAKLVAALALAVLAWVVSQMIRPLLDDSMAFGRFNEVNALLAAVIGWRMIGRQAGQGVVQAATSGVNAAVVLVLFALALHALYEMIRLGMRRAYRSPMDGFEDLFEIALEFGTVLLNPMVAGALLAGGIAVAILAELVDSISR